MIHFKNHKRGFTLIETLLSMMIVGIVLTPLFILHGVIMQRVNKSSKQLYEWYAERWCIETVFRFVKSELNLQDCQGFEFIQHHNHIGYCFLAYGLLRGAFPGMNPYDAKRRFESMYITKTVTLNPEVFTMCA